MDAMLEKFNGLMDTFESRGWDPTNKSTQTHQQAPIIESSGNDMREPDSANVSHEEPESDTDDVESLPDHGEDHAPTGHLVADAQGKLR